jgi:hypothetical protein
MARGQKKNNKGNGKRLATQQSVRSALDGIGYFPNGC